MTGPGDADDPSARLIAEIEAEMAETAAWTGRPSLSPRVRDALVSVDRARFVPEGLRDLAWLNRPLPIGDGQTISQPFIVAVMTELLDLAPTDKVLEIGTGSGYQAAILSRLADRVWSIEVVPALAAAATRRLERLGHANVEVRLGQGDQGWPEAAPFDAVIVTAAAQAIPPALVEQLRPGGRLVIPVGADRDSQVLVRAVRRADGGLDRRDLFPVAFVPFV